jgi:hypothetical protein
MTETAELTVPEGQGSPEIPIPDQGPEEEFNNSKIYCANCIHCKLIPAMQEGDSHYFLRVRCAAGKWRKKLGEEKMYKYCTITRRYMDECDAYEEMGDTGDFIRELKKTVPGKDEQYTLSQKEPEARHAL